MISQFFMISTSIVKRLKIFSISESRAKSLKLMLAMFLVALFSCQRVIDLDLNTSESYVVVQGNVYDKTGPYTVTLSKTVDFDEENEYPTVQNAFVTISDDHGVIDTLDETDYGEYTTTKLEGTPGSTYYLTINVDDETYTATSQMPEPVTIDSIYFEESSREDDVYETIIEFADPAETENYYRLVFYYNDKKSDNIMVVSDELYNGETITYRVSARSDEGTAVRVGQKVTIWLESIDKDVYEFFRTAASNSNESVTPSNPDSNISNGAIGYFNCCSYTIKSTLVSASK